MWVADDRDGKVYAYSIVSETFGERRSALELNNLRQNGNASAKGIWSNGAVMWISDDHDNRIYAYDMPSTPKLSSLSLTDVDFGGFYSWESSYSAFLTASGATQTTVTAVAADATSYDVTITPADSDANTAGHQVSIAAGTQTISITLTHNTDSSLSRTYMVTIVKSSSSMPSNDSTLSALSLGAGTDIGTFVADVTDYSSDVPASTSSLTVAATPTDSDAIVTITPSDSDAVTAGHQINLGFGRTRIAVRSVSSDGTSNHTYRVLVTRDAILSDLEVLDQDGDEIRMEEYAPLVASYQALAHSTTTAVTVKATAAGTGATVS